MSIGSSSRDHEVEIELLGEQFRIRREGHDGDFDKAVDFLRQSGFKRVSNLTGGILAWSEKILTELDIPPRQVLIEAKIYEVKLTGALAWGLVTGGQGRCEFARLPLSEDGKVVSQILAMEDYDFPKLDALPSAGDSTR